MLFRAMYRVGFTPWDGHPLAKSLHDLVEGNGSPALPAATALDIGCGTGDASIYLAQHGWQVTGVDFVPRALAKARAKAQARQASVNFVQGRCHPPQLGPGRGDRVYVDRRQRLLT
jgi:2-polyprenyl-3-methyl-5-hydroxy-6-metoxy-1,4-benzoquinol methylase